MSDEMIIGIAIGWFLGSSIMWAWFSISGLIRNREEWEENRKKNPPVTKGGSITPTAPAVWIDVPGKDNQKTPSQR